ncbi:MAG: hypothetical protein KC414_11705, partial [Romboutsia sp.]|nr:hypothetical protein [Romboutsia sp.]
SFFLHQIKKEGLIFDSILFNPLLTIITFIITVAIVFLLNYLNEKIASQKLKDYYNLAKQIVMAIEQLNSELP